MSDSDAPSCGRANNEKTFTGLRIASVFIILATSLAGTLFPVVAKRAWKIPSSWFDFVKYFGSGVIIATAFIHLLAPAFDELGSDCLSGAWTEYDWAPAIAMASVFSIFFLELFAVRYGSKLLENAGGQPYEPHAETGAQHGHGHPHHDIVLGSTENGGSSDKGLDYSGSDLEVPITSSGDAAAQIIGVAILEFGVIFHSIIIGLTLAVNSDFKTLFVVIIFHQMFEGLGLGTRLAYLALPRSYSWVPYAGGIAYSIMTPLGIAIGLGVRTTYNADGTTANIVTGVLDATSAGILLYTGLVELLAHEFLFNPKMKQASTGKLLFSMVSILIGAGIMALLGRWA